MLEDKTMEYNFDEYKEYIEGSEELEKEYKIAALEKMEKLLEAKLDFTHKIRQILEKTRAPEPQEIKEEKIEKNGKKEKSDKEVENKEK